eukprot:CAMPEP_0185749556 /NCGR_PEP_ID=MMETSP1174-20130828/8252_1 /TAXON_ID=35687 /ORGANISM="Dictyocha speculum, Strain CCMP1381" /LENGTH=139 /DNA_ID=CAMNT_0028425711 /DNA_START=200 /DNA_END=619 /DNA_ORIENTATION=+
MDSPISCVACVQIAAKYASHGAENSFGADRAIKTAKLICCICAGVALIFPNDRSCGTDSLVSPLLAVGFRLLASVMHRNTIQMETHVVGCYVETQQYRSLEEAPYGALEWSTAGEVLGWINEHRAVTSNDPRSLADTVI